MSYGESRSSESNSYSSGSSWGYSKPSESRGESRTDSRSTRVPSESQRTQGGRFYSSESRSYDTPVRKYNSLADVDKLIKKLEGSMPQIDSGNPAVNEALQAKQQKIDELKKLVQQAREAEKERQLLAQIKRDTDEIDEAMNSVRGMGK